MNNTEKIDISVICLTYNQKEYVEQMLRSVLEQKTDVKCEVLIHDDASNDGTQDILVKVRDANPEKIILLLETENKFSKNIDYFSDIVKNKARGKYIALCEGDDYWTVNDKLQAQFTALEQHPECDMCACGTVMISEDGQHDLGTICPKNECSILSVEEVIAGGGNYVASAGLFFRKAMFDEMYAFEKIRSLDYSHQIKGAMRGGIFYIDRIMAAYRRYSKSSVTSQITTDLSAMSIHCEQEKKILMTLDKETGGKYHGVIERRLEDYGTTFLGQLHDNRDVILGVLRRESNKKLFLWGMGPRGKNLERFLMEEGISIDGVCDITDVHVGETTDEGNDVLSCESVLKNAEVILASVTGAYEFLMTSDFDGSVYNMQEYMSRA